MYSFFYKKVDSTEAVSNNYISVNNFGYYEDITDIKTYRESGRVDYQLIYVKRGRLIVGKNGNEHILSEGRICLFRPGEAQIYRGNGDATTYFWIHFSGCEAERMLSFFKERSYCVGVFPEFEYYCRGSSHEAITNREFTELLYEGRLIALFARIAEKINSSEKKDDDVSKIRPAIIAMHADNQNRHTNEELCQLCGLSKDYFLKLFKNSMGITPQQYYIALAVDKGRYLLTNTSYSISEISLLCGIVDSFYFSRIFKKHTGLSPRDYRNTGGCNFVL